MVLDSPISTDASRTLQISTESSMQPHKLFVPLKWAGGKRWLVPLLREIWSVNSGANTRLVEPFAGGLSVAIGIQPKYALLADINPHVINFYRWVQKGVLLNTPYRNSRASFLKARKRFNQLISTSHGKRSKEAAATFYYLNRTCFNGLCRFNSSGEFNVPFGRYKTINYVRDFGDLTVLMKHWKLAIGSYKYLKPKRDDFIYADPPYDVEFTSYSKGGFDWDDQVHLAGWLAAHTGPVVASNQATERIKALYLEHGFRYIERPGPRRISCDGNRSPATEILAYKNIELPRGTT